MNIGAILPKSDRAVNRSKNDIPCGDEFEKMLQQIHDETDIEKMKKCLDETFQINTIVTEYSCEKTDSAAEKHDTSMLEQLDMTGGRNVVISKKVLLRMKKDSSFRQKVYKSIKDIPWSGKATSGVVKSNGVFIHEDGTGGYYLEFDWGDETEQKKSQTDKAVYSDNTKEINEKAITFDDQNQIGLQTELLSPLLGTYRKEKNSRFF